LSRNPDDTWSGRGNDARRAYGDGWRDALAEVAYSLRLNLTLIDSTAAADSDPVGGAL
jgi:hypothetical protein